MRIAMDRTVGSGLVALQRIATKRGKAVPRRRTAVRLDDECLRRATNRPEVPLAVHGMSNKHNGRRSARCARGAAVSAVDPAE